MITLINIWYIFSGAIGVILGIGCILSALLGAMLLIIGIPVTIKDRSYDEIPLLLGMIASCVVIILITICINVNIPKAQKQVITEIPNIISYEGIADVKEGKYNYDNMYFKQGTNSNYAIVKLDPDKCKIHSTSSNSIKIMESNTEYTSPFRFLAIMNLDEKTYYDVYLPKK